VQYPEAWVNLSALHHKHGRLEDAVFHYKRSVAAVLNSEEMNEVFFDRVVEGGDGEAEIVKEVAGNPEFYDLMLMIMNNLGQALSQTGDVKNAIKHHHAAVALLETRLQLLSTVDFSLAESEIMENTDQLLHTKAHIWRASKVNGEWKEFANFQKLKREVDEFQLANGMDSALLPFDTLGSDVEPMWRKNIAVQHAGMLSRFSEGEPKTDLRTPRRGHHLGLRASRLQRRASEA